MTTEKTMLLVEHRLNEPGEHELVQVRQLEEGEAARIQAADELVTKIAGAGDYRRLQARVQRTHDLLLAVQERQDPQPRDVRGFVESLPALVTAHALLADDVAELLADAARSQSTDDAIAALAELRADPGLARLTAVAAGQTQVLRDRDGVLGTLVDNQRFVQLLGDVVVSFERASGAFTLTLAARAQDVLEAGIVLRQLHVECPEGRPNLMGADDIEGLPAGKLHPRELALHHIAPALHMARRALAAIGVTDPGMPFEPPSPDAEDAPLADGNSAVGDGEPASRSGPATSDPLGGGGAVDDEARGAAERGPEEPTAEASEGAHESQIGHTREHDPSGRSATTPDESGVGPISPVVDLNGLVRLAAVLNDDLEKAWSGALNRAQTEAGIEAQVAAVRAAVGSFYTSSLESPVMVSGIPVDPSRLEAFETADDRDEERRATTEIVALMKVLKALEVITQPSTVRVTISDGGTEKLSEFWSSGGFSQLRGQLESLRSILNNTSAQAQERGDVFRHLRLAGARWHGGDPEACLFHAVCALAQLLPGEVATLADRIGDNPEARAAGVGIRTVFRMIAGERCLEMATLTAASTADFASDLFMPPGLGTPSDAREVFDRIAADIPYEPVPDE